MTATERAVRGMPRIFEALAPEAGFADQVPNHHCLQLAPCPYCGTDHEVEVRMEGMTAVGRCPEMVSPAQQLVVRARVEVEVRP